MATSINYQPRTELDYTGPSWNNSNEYPSLTSNEFTYDRQQLESLTLRLTEILKTVMPLPLVTSPGVETLTSNELVTALQAICELEEQAWVLLGNMQTYANCLACVDGERKDAKTELSRLASASGQLEALTKPVHVFLALAPDSFIEAYLSHPHVKPYAFQLRERREIANTLLSEAEESLLARLKTNGPLAFGAQYDQLSSSIRCHYENPETNAVETIGLSQAASLIRDGSEAKRRNAWRAIQHGWKSQEVAAAAGLNALAGWRNDETDQRSARRRSKNPDAFDMTVLDLSLKESRISGETLSAMFSAVHSRIELPRRALRAMAKAIGKEKLDPWDLLAPAPTSAPTAATETLLTFDKGIGLIRDAFDDVDPMFSDFVDTMKKNRWIEGRSLPTKRPGAFCTSFAKSSSPRVFQTYNGSLEDVRTLAHELGHAYHSWAMKDLPRVLLDYPMTIAETASVFAETVFSDSLLKRAKASGDSQAALEISWQNAESAAGFLLNIPARFDFERALYERRRDGYLSPDDLSDLMSTSWEKWYGETLTGYERQFWMTKLHFSIGGMSFYNYPYTFGYLFSLGIYAQKEKLREKFWPMYNSLLRDTGRMTAEDLARKYLDADLTSPKFWLQSLDIVEAQVAEFESLV